MRTNAQQLTWNARGCPWCGRAVDEAAGSGRCDEMHVGSPALRALVAQAQAEGWSQVQVASALGVDASTLRRWISPDDAGEHRQAPAWACRLLAHELATDGAGVWPDAAPRP